MFTLPNGKFDNIKCIFGKACKIFSLSYRAKLGVSSSAVVLVLTESDHFDFVDLLSGV